MDMSKGKRDPRGLPDFTTPINIAMQSITPKIEIAEAIVNISALKLMDTGVVKRLWIYASNGTYTLYTVPTGKRFYIFSAALNVRHWAAGDHEADIHLYDGTTQYRILWLISPDSVEQMNDAIAFTLCSIPAGWAVRMYVNGYSAATACVLGVEI
jgi:hypothetical protein